ncbi:MAG: DUF192 domain-containing protein [Spirochaetota bacterium]
MNGEAGSALAAGLFSGTRKSAVLSLNGRPLYVEIARTRKQRQRGLMHREELAPDQGMLFVFPEDRYLSFWMKDTGLPLSIAFIDAGGRVVDIYPLEPYSLIPVRSTRKCRYALETNRGFFRDAGVERGDIIDLEPIRR